MTSFFTNIQYYSTSTSLIPLKKNGYFEEENVLLSKINQLNYKMMLCFYETLNQFYETLTWIDLNLPQILKNNAINKLNSKLIILKNIFAAISSELSFDKQYGYTLKHEFNQLLLFFHEVYINFVGYLQIPQSNEIIEQFYFLKEVLEMKDSCRTLENRKNQSDQEIDHVINEKIFGNFLSKIEMNRIALANLNEDEIYNKKNILMKKINDIYQNPIAAYKNFYFNKTESLNIMINILNSNTSEKIQSCSEIIRKISYIDLWSLLNHFTEEEINVLPSISDIFIYIINIELEKRNFIRLN